MCSASREIGTGKTKRIALLVAPEALTSKYLELVDIVVSDDLIEAITKGELYFDILTATPDMMPKLAKLGRILGPKGLMPSPKAGTETIDGKEFEQFVSNYTGLSKQTKLKPLS